MLHDTTNKNVFVFEKNPEVFPLCEVTSCQADWKQGQRGKDSWCCECPWAPAAVKTSNEAFGPHLALLTTGKTFLQRSAICRVPQATTLTWAYWHLYAVETDVPPSAWHSALLHRWAQVLAWHRGNIVITFKCQVLDFFLYVSHCNFGSNFILVRINSRHYLFRISHWLKNLRGNNYRIINKIFLSP